MKITMLATMCGPNGSADPGAVLDIPAAEARKLLCEEKDDKGNIIPNESGGPFARLYDPEKDAKPRHVGLRKYARTDE